MTTENGITMEMTAVEMAAAAERERRQRVLKKAIASYSDRAITQECLVRDLSENGVRLKLTTPLPLPDRFTLEIPMDGIVVECEVRWRKGDTLGAVFVGEIAYERKHEKQTIDPSGFAPSRHRLRRRPIG